MALAFLFVELSRVVGFFPIVPEPIIYGIMILFGYSFINKSKKTDSIILLFLAYIPLEIVLTSPPALFKPWMRFFILCILLASCSCLFQSETNRINRIRVFYIICGFCAFLGVGSFFAKFLGVNYMKVGRLDILNNVGLFGGLTKHSMLLGPISAIGFLFLLHFAFMKKSKILWGGAMLSMLSVMFASSRSAFASVLVGFILYLYVRSNHTSKLLKYVVILVTFVSSTIPLWENAMSGIFEKQRNNTELGGTFASRESKWSQRILEFESSPIFGYGFVSVDIGNKDNSIGEDGSSLEPGSSWLSVVSMLGIIGGVLIFIVLKESFVQVYKKEKDPFLTSVLSMLFVNMCTEGYIFFGGSFLCLLFWLTTGVCIDRKYSCNNLSL